LEDACESFKQTDVNPWSGRPLKKGGSARYNQIAGYCRDVAHTQGLPDVKVVRQPPKKKAKAAQSTKGKKSKKGANVAAAAKATTAAAAAAATEDEEEEEEILAEGVMPGYDVMPGQDMDAAVTVPWPASEESGFGTAPSSPMSIGDEESFSPQPPLGSMSPVEGFAQGGDILAALLGAGGLAAFKQAEALGAQEKLELQKQALEDGATTKKQREGLPQKLAQVDAAIESVKKKVDQADAVMQAAKEIVEEAIQGVPKDPQVVAAVAQVSKAMDMVEGAKAQLEDAQTVRSEDRGSGKSKWTVLVKPTTQLGGADGLFVVGSVPRDTVICAVSGKGLQLYDRSSKKDVHGDAIMVSNYEFLDLAEGVKRRDAPLGFQGDRSIANTRGVNAVLVIDHHQKAEAAYLRTLPNAGISTYDKPVELVVAYDSGVNLQARNAARAVKSKVIPPPVFKNLPHREAGKPMHVNTFLAAAYACCIAGGGKLSDLFGKPLIPVERAVKAAPGVAIEAIINAMDKPEVPVEAVEGAVALLWEAHKPADMDFWTKLCPDLFESSYTAVGTCPTHGIISKSVASTKHVVSGNFFASISNIFSSKDNARMVCSSTAGGAPPCPQRAAISRRHYSKVPPILSASSDMFEIEYSVPSKLELNDLVINAQMAEPKPVTLTYRVTAILNNTGRHWFAYLRYGSGWYRYSDAPGVKLELLAPNTKLTGIAAFFTLNPLC
jgi:hypothetical protein